MTRLFSVILSLSVSGGLVGLLVLAFRPAASRFFAKRWTYCLWLLVIARLLVPVHGDINLMAYLSAKLPGAGSSPSQAGSEAELDGRATTAWEGLQDESESADGAEVTDRTLREDGGVEAEADAERVEGAVGQDRAESLTESGRAGSELHETGGMAAEVGKAAEQDMVQTGGSRSAVGAGSASGVTDGTVGSVWKQILQVAAVVWLIGVLFTALRKLWIYRRFVKEISACGMENANRRGLSQGGMSGAAGAPVSDRQILGQYAEIQKRLDVRKIVPLYESVVIDSPMLVGLCSPCIYLPSGLLREMRGKENDIGLMLHHELVHYKRHDIWYKWLFQAALCVHWFNPLVYIFNRKFHIDCELACDETVLKLLSEEGRRAYGNVLLDVAQKNWFEGAFSEKGMGMYRNMPTMTLLEEKSTLKERLRGIARYHKTGLAVGICSAVVLVLFLGLALVCGAAGVRGGSGETFSMRNYGNPAVNFVEHFWEKSMWSEMWGDSFELNQPILVSSNGKAYRMYDDDALIAEDSTNDCWRAWVYSGGDRSVNAQKFMFNGSDTLWILYANKETTLEISSVFRLYDGRFKIVCVRPDQTVQTLNESGEENTVKVTLPQGRNVIKMVGQKAKLEDLGVAYGKIKQGDFDGIYEDETSEYAYQVLDGKQRLDPARLKDVCPYLKKKEVSELGRRAWEDGVLLSKEDWQDLFIYSDEKMTAQYLLEGLQAGRAGEFDSSILVEIAPYMVAEDVSECFRYLLERDAVSDSDWESIFVYSDANKSAKYLAEALRIGKADGFNDEALEQICYRVSVKELTDVVTAMDELSFEGLEHVLAFVQQMDEAVDCICHYIDLGNALTDAQLREIKAYLSEEDFYRIVEYNGGKK